MKISTEIIQLWNRWENQPTAGHVIHSGKLHPRDPLEFIEDRSLSLVALGNRDIHVLSSDAENCLEWIEHMTMCSPPLINYTQVLFRRLVGTDSFSCPVDTRLGTSREVNHGGIVLSSTE
jgi:hypothetical protein